MSSGLLIYKVVGEKILKGGWRIGEKMNHFFKKCFENQNTKCPTAGTWALAKSLIRKFVENSFIFSPFRHPLFLLIKKTTSNYTLQSYFPFLFYGGSWK
ncbi:MAG: hypothetical protein EAZ66_07165 [Alphaproteobacteria bacterium]|nr:MAG: hypothetical protein EAZ66_07165 [Alphaproteobacteria bacterium]